jgi:hypothetical protein
MKTERKEITQTYLAPEIREKYTRLYGKPTTGASRAAHAFVHLRAATLHELKGMFTRAELSAMVDNLNAVMFDPAYAANNNVLRAGIEDGQKYDGLLTNWNVDPEDIYTKIALLTAAQCYFLMDEIDRFWNEPVAWGSPTPDLEAFLDEMCGKE